VARRVNERFSAGKDVSHRHIFLGGRAREVASKGRQRWVNLVLGRTCSPALNLLEVCPRLLSPGELGLDVLGLPAKRWQLPIGQSESFRPVQAFLQLDQAVAQLVFGAAAQGPFSRYQDAQRLIAGSFALPKPVVLLLPLTEERLPNAGRVLLGDRRVRL